MLRMVILHTASNSFGDSGNIKIAEIEIEQTISFWQSLRSIIGVDILSVSVAGLNLFFMNRNLYLVSDLITVCIFK